MTARPEGLPEPVPGTGRPDECAADDCAAAADYPVLINDRPVWMCEVHASLAPPRPTEGRAVKTERARA